ncbi:CLUMA_CG001306, isoform A [Clunio marinus]|uniref:CLUMA_CG001306, isoform A n=1 Tax=Clunio marinus TaxID=568069 RepID=A0A1J1HMN9_9DIPT|nr:CLUMA_CG001306, isoform A [Clunio marinus]
MDSRIYRIAELSTSTLLKLVLFLSLAQGYTKSEKEKLAPVTNVEAIEGQQAHLFCPMATPKGDKINMVLWFKDDVGVPIYRFDVRGKSISEATTWSDLGVFGTRAKFITQSEPAFLEIDVSRPQPEVSWFMNGNLVDDEYEHNSGNIIENRLLWPSLQRTDLYSVFTCRAANTKTVAPREKRLVLDMYLKPIQVNILNSSLTLVADRKYEIHCSTTGSRPDAIITWLKGKKSLKRTREYNKNNQTTSILNFVPSIEDNGKTLTCHSENPNVAGMFIEDNWNMSVFYPPVISLQLGSKLQAGDIKEGDDVYFECKIDANPKFRRLTWLHNGRALKTNSSTKIIKSNQSLVLQRVTRFSAGKYSCSALNSEGETVSNEFLLKVKFVPLCATDKMMVVGATKGEDIKLTCEIKSYPLPRRFYWKFENSEESIETDQQKFSNNGTRSILNFSTATDHDYGSLSCWAKNEIGIQSQPCIFQLILAGPPTPVTNCSWNNESESSLIVNCSPSYDGGLPQTFVLEILSLKHKIQLFNQSNTVEPTFRLDPNRKIIGRIRNSTESDVLKVFVFSRNQKGRSQGTFITEYHLGNYKKQSSDLVKRVSQPSPILLGLFFTILLLGLTIIARLYWKSRKIKKEIVKEDKYNMESRCSLLKQDTFAADAFSSPKYKPAGTSIKTRGKIETIDDEQDPDLIPHYPRLTNNIHQEELIPMNSDPSFLNRDRHKNEANDFLTDVEINFQLSIMNGKVPESCV